MSYDAAPPPIRENRTKMNVCFTTSSFLYKSKKIFPGKLF